MPEPSNNPTSDNESNQTNVDTQEKINQELKQIYNRMAFEVIFKAYEYYILGESDWHDLIWDRRAREVYLNRHTLEPKFKEVFDQLKGKRLSMRFLKLQDYERVLNDDDEETTA